MWFVLVPFRQKHIEVILGSGLKGVFDTMIYLCLPREGYATLILCLIFPLKIGQNAQWEQLFSMYFNDFLPFALFFSPFSMRK